MDRWTAYLFEEYSENTIINWAQRLNILLFFRAYGGHAGDSDEIKVSFIYDSESDLLKFFDLQADCINMCLERPEQPVAGLSYSGYVFDRFPSLIKGTKWIEQPKRTEICGEKVFIWCRGGKITISMGHGFLEGEKNVKSAERIEPFLSNVPLSVLEPPVDSKHCICPKYYPDYYR